MRVIRLLIPLEKAISVLRRTLLDEFGYISYQLIPGFIRLFSQALGRFVRDYSGIH